MGNINLIAFNKIANSSWSISILSITIILIKNISIGWIQAEINSNGNVSMNLILRMGVPWNRPILTIFSKQPFISIGSENFKNPPISWLLCLLKTPGPTQRSPGAGSWTPWNRHSAGPAKAAPCTQAVSLRHGLPRGFGWLLTVVGWSSWLVDWASWLVGAPVSHLGWQVG